MLLQGKQRDPQTYFVYFKGRAVQDCESRFAVPVISTSEKIAKKNRTALESDPTVKAI